MSMRRHIAAAAAVATTILGGVAPASATTLPPGGGGSSIVTMSSRYAADPGLSKIGGRYYIGATGGSRNGSSDGILPIFSGTSLSAGFTKVGNGYRSAPAGYSKFWAPHIVSRNGKYFMFFTAKNASRPQHCVYWAVSSSPSGGYGAPHQLVCGGASTWEAIDPSTYVTTAGNTYLLWRRGHIAAFPTGSYEIKSRMLSFVGSSVSFVASSPYATLLSFYNTTVAEAPSMVYHGGKVWLFISRGRFDTNAYHTDVYAASSIHGTFTFVRHLMATGQGYGYGPGGAEVVDSSGTIRIAWHVWDRSKPYPSSPGTRITKMSYLTWSSSGPTVSR